MGIAGFVPMWSVWWCWWFVYVAWVHLLRMWRARNTGRMNSNTLCPVSELAGEDHYFQTGSGQVIEWDVMGDSRTELEVCASCAEAGMA